MGCGVGRSLNSDLIRSSLINPIAETAPYHALQRQCGLVAEGGGSEGVSAQGLSFPSLGNLDNLRHFSVP